MKRTKKERYPACEKIDCKCNIESMHGNYHICLALHDNDFKRSDGTAYECPFYKKAGENKQ